VTILKTFLRTLGASLAALCILAASMPQANAAVALVAAQNQYTTPNVRLVAFGDITGGYSNATTSYTDVTGSSFTYTPPRNDCTTAGQVLFIGQSYACLIKVTWSFDVTKATATTGSCAVFVNGAVVANSARFASSAARQTIGGVLVVANTVVGTQTIKMQCISADTNALTVTNGHVVVEDIAPVR
jgi:hypothetical protein